MNTTLINSKDFQVTFFLSPLSKMIEHQFKRHVYYTEDFVLKKLRTTDLLRFSEIHDLFIHLHTPVMYAIVLLGCLIMSLIATPYVFYNKSCFKKTINPMKCQCCFSFELLLLVLFMICFLLGVIGSYQIAVEIQEALMAFPALYNNLTGIYLRSACSFQMDVQNMVSDIENSIEQITDIIVKLPKQVTGLLLELCNPNLQKAIFKLHDLQLQAINAQEHYTIHNNTIMEFKRVMDHTIDNFLKISKRFRSETFETYNTNSTKKIVDALYLMKNEIEILYLNKFKPVVTDLHILEKLLMATQGSMLFIEQLYIKLKYGNGDLQRMLLATSNFQVKLYEVEHNVTLALKDLFPEDTIDAILKTSYKVDKLVSSLSITRHYHESHLANGMLYLMLLPSTYALVAWIILIIALLCATKELRKIISNVSWISTSYQTLKLLRVSAVFSVSFLWLLFLITIFFYYISLPVSVICEAMNDKKLFTSYIDKESPVWNNKTWIDHKIGQYLPKHSTLTVHNILNECHKNQSVYTSFSMNEYWNVTNTFEQLNVTQDFQAMQGMIGKYLNNIDMPDDALEQLIQGLFKLKENVEMRNFQNYNLTSPQKLKELTMETKIFDMFKWNQNSTDIINTENMLNDFQKNINDLNMIYIPNLINIYFKEVPIEECIAGVMDNVLEVRILVKDVPDIMKRAREIIIPNFFNTTTDKITNILQEAESTLKYKLQKPNGQCNVLPLIYNSTVWSLCNYSFPVIMGAWVSVGMVSICMAFCILFSCRLSGYIRGANSYYCHWKKNTTNGIHTGRPKMHSTLLYDSKKHIVGEAILLNKPSRSTTLKIK